MLVVLELPTLPKQSGDEARYNISEHSSSKLENDINDWLAQIPACLEAKSSECYLPPQASFMSKVEGEGLDQTPVLEWNVALHTAALANEFMLR